MKISQQAKAIVQGVNTWAQANGGSAVVAADLRHLWEIVRLQSASPRVIVCYDGERIRGDFEWASQAGRVDRRFIVALTRGRGLNLSRGDNLAETLQASRPLFDLLEELRDVIRCLRDISVEDVMYTGVDSMTIADVLADGYMIKFMVAADLPEIVTQPENTEEILNT